MEKHIFDERSNSLSHQNKQKNKITKFLLTKKIVRSEQHALIVQYVIIAVCIGTAIFLSLPETTPQIPLEDFDDEIFGE